MVLDGGKKYLNMPIYEGTVPEEVSTSVLLEPHGSFELPAMARLMTRCSTLISAAAVGIRLLRVLWERARIEEVGWYCWTFGTQSVYAIAV